MIFYRLNIFHPQVTYRAYAQDEVYEIVEKESSESRVGLEAILTLVRDYPAGDVGSGALPGMHILNSLPGTVFIFSALVIFTNRLNIRRR